MKKSCPDCEGTGGLEVNVDGSIEYEVCERCKGTGKIDPHHEKLERQLAEYDPIEDHERSRREELPDTDGGE